VPAAVALLIFSVYINSYFQTKITVLKIKSGIFIRLCNLGENEKLEEWDGCYCINQKIESWTRLCPALLDLSNVWTGFQVRTEVGLGRAGFQVKNEVQDGQGSRLELKVRKDMDAVVWADGQQGLVFRRLLRACQEGQGFTVC
jgi:hypothetical protein